MPADGHLNFDTKIDTKGFEKGADKLGTDFKRSLSGVESAFRKTFSRSGNAAYRSVCDLSSRLRPLFGGIAAAAAAAFSVRSIVSFVREAQAAYNVQLEAETRLEQVLRNTTGAADEQIDSVKEWASQLQRVGVIGDEITLSGLQELGTYIENADSLKTMAGVLDDMLAQQYGLNATAESAVTISTMLGKVLEGQTSALSRYGYSFTDAQERLLKYGTEEQRVATLAQVVGASVGGMNEALAATPAGRIKQLSNTIGDIKEQLGQAAVNVRTLLLPALERLAGYLSHIAELAVRATESIAGIFGVSLESSAAVTGNISESVSAQEELTEAVEETAKAQQKSLAGFDRINTLTSQAADSAPQGTAGSSYTPVMLDDTPAEKKLDRLAQKLKKLAEPVTLAWRFNSGSLISGARTALDHIKPLIKSVGESLEEVWTGGSGERYIGNILTLLGDVLGIIGDISAALENAWNKGGRGTALVQSFFDRKNEFLELAHTFADTFREAWNEGIGESIFSHIIGIFTNINTAWANLWSSMKKAWSKSGKRIWRALLRILDNVLEVIDDITGAASEWLGDLDLSPLTDAAADLLEAIEPFTKQVGEGLKWLYENVLLPVGKWTIEKYAPALLHALGGAVEFISSIVKLGKSSLKWGWEDFLKPLGEWGGKIVSEGLEKLGSALSGIASFIDEHIESFTALTKLLSYFSEPLGSMKLADDLKDIFSEPLGEKWEETKDLLAEIPGWFGEKFAAARENVSDAFEDIGDWFGKRRDDIKKAFRSIPEWFRDKFESAKTSVHNAFGTIGEWFGQRSGAVKGAFADISGWFRDKFESAKTSVHNAFGTIGEWFGQRSGAVKGVFADTPGWFRDKFGDAWSKVKSAFSGIGEFFGRRSGDVKTPFGGIPGWFRNTFSDAYSSVTQAFSDFGSFFGDIWYDIKNGFRDALNFIIEKAESCINHILGGLNSLSFDLPDIFGGGHIGFDIGYVDLPRIPELAAGTVIPANYGRFLAMLGDNKRETEVVSPLSTIEKAVANALQKNSGGESVIHVHLDLDSREIGRVAVRAVNSDNARKGR